MRPFSAGAPGPRYSRCIAMLLMLAVLPTSGLAQAAPPFPDMTHSWYGYQESVSYLIKKGSIDGYPDGTFKPRTTVNRAEFLKLVFRSRGTAEPVTGECFADVQPDAWFAPYVCAAKRRGIVEGYKVGSRSIFKPEQQIVFAEAVKMILLAYGKEVAPASGEKWYKPFVEELDRQNILASSSYIPWEPITRERAADLIARFVRSSEDHMIANHSPGCGKPHGNAETTLQVNGQARSYLLTRARNEDENKPSPLIVAFHGRTNGNEQVRSYFGLDREADEYYVAYPAGISNGNGTYSWSDPGNKTSELRDYAFFDAIVKELAESYCIDMDRIFVVGHSLGAWFANSVACARGGVVRASATVGGSTTMTGCTGPSAAMIINNPKDALSSHAAAESMREIRLTKNTCEPRWVVTDPQTLSCQMYASCGENPIVFCPHTINTDHNGTYYPHVWPPGTAGAMVRFFGTL